MVGVVSHASGHATGVSERLPDLLAYTFDPALGLAERLASADAEGRRRLGRRTDNGP